MSTCISEYFGGLVSEAFFTSQALRAWPSAHQPLLSCLQRAHHSLARCGCSLFRSVLHSGKLHGAGIGVSLVLDSVSSPLSGAWQRVPVHSSSAGRPERPMSSSIRSYCPVPSSSIHLLWLEGLDLTPLLQVHPLSLSWKVISLSVLDYTVSHTNLP